MGFRFRVTVNEKEFAGEIVDRRLNAFRQIPSGGTVAKIGPISLDRSATTILPERPTQNRKKRPIRAAIG
jgi:hypothetical protein